MIMYEWLSYMSVRGETDMECEENKRCIMVEKER